MQIEIRERLVPYVFIVLACLAKANSGYRQQCVHRELFLTG